MDNTFGERIRELRKKRRLTRDELGDILGVSGNAVTAYETGRRNPRKEVIDKLCDYFDVRYDWLTGESPYKNDRLVRITTVVDDNGVALEKHEEVDDIDLLIECYRQMPSQRKQALLDYALYLKKKP